MKMTPVSPSTSSSLMHPHQQFRVTEDTPVDYLEGCMEILVVFPNEKNIPMSVQRRMPMLDLLIHVTAANKIPPSSHVLHVTDQEGRSLTHKPSTPIGSLNAHTVYIVPKNRLAGDRLSFADGSQQTRLRSGNIPLSTSSSSHQFEPSFRLQVRLPRSQLFVTRVTGRTLLGDLLRTVCNEKDLDPRYYELRHPVNLDERLRLNSCLDDYKLTEVVIVATTGTNSQPSSTHDLSNMNSNKNGKVGGGGSSNNNIPASDNKTSVRMAASNAALHPVHQDKKKRGLFGIFNFGKSKKGSSLGDSSISSDSVGDRSISPSRSDEAGPAHLPPEPCRPSSPFLVSKRLAEEAVAKRNSRLSQLSTENAVIVQAQVSPPSAKTANGGVKGPPKAGNKKRMAPAPPPAVSTGSEVSSSSSSGSTAISPSNMTAESTPSPKMTKNPLRFESSSNLVSSRGVCTSNLTLVSSTSNASLTSAVKKRKAPTAPPPALSEQSEVQNHITSIQPSSRPSTPISRTADGDSESTISHVSTPSDVAVSPIPPPVATSTPSPSVEPVFYEEVVDLKPEVTAPKPAARSRFSQISSKDPPSASSVFAETTILLPQDKKDDEEKEVDLKLLTRQSDAHVQKFFSPQLQLQEKQNAEAKRKRLGAEKKQQVRESERMKKEQLLAKERTHLETIEQQKTAHEKVDLLEQPSRRKQWSLPADMVLNLDKTLTTENYTPKPKGCTSSAISPTSSGSEFFSLSENETDRDTPEVEEEDADAVFAAMCAALARRKLQHGPVLPEPDEEEESAFWHRSSSDRDLTSPQRLSQSPVPNQAARRSNSFEAGQQRSVKRGSDALYPAADPLHFPSLSSTLLSNYQHLRGEYEDISLSLANDRDQNDRTGAGSPILRRRQRSELGESLTSNGSTKSGEVVGIDTTATPPPTSEDDDYDDLDYDRTKKTDTVSVSQEQTSVAERVMAVEPLYTMIVKSPWIIQALDQEPKGPPVNGVNHAEAVSYEVEREAGDGQQAGESPIPWEYKLPAPPTPFQDSLPVAPPADSIVTMAESSSRPTSSMSADSLQDNFRTEASLPETCVMLKSGAELLEESVTEELLSPIKKQEIFILTSDPREQQYGLESTTDELHLQSAPSSMPPLPTSSPPPESDEDDHVYLGNTSLDADMRFSITTYNRRVAKDSTYDKKLLRSDSSELSSLMEPEETVDDRHSVKVDAPLAFGDTKEPEVAAVRAKAQDPEFSGNEISIEQALPPATKPGIQPVSAIIPADFIQQFQSVLAQHTIAEPQARALQEDFFRLQQQLLTLQLQVAQSPKPETTITEDPSSIEQTCEEPISAVTLEDTQEPMTKLMDSHSSDLSMSLVEPIKTSLDFPSNERGEPFVIPIKPVMEPVIHHYRGPPQVKMDTWKPGRPRSEVVDFSRSSSFNVPFAKKESMSKDVPDFGGRASVTTQDAVSEVEDKKVVAAEQNLDKQMKEEIAKSKEVALQEEQGKLAILPVEEPMIEPVIVRQKVNNIEKSGSALAVGEKPIVMRKSSFLTARPFEARPMSMPIKRPNFSPMIQPVPFVSRKIKAPEVRGFASLPPVETDTPSSPPAVNSPTSSKPPLASSSVIGSNKPRLISQISMENATVTIRNKLIQSARRPSAELDGSPLNITDSTNLATASKELITDEPPPRAPRPMTMPMSSCLLLAAGAVNKHELSTSPFPSIPAPPLFPPSEKDGSIRRSLSSKFVRRVDPREELLNSIRDFANGGTLKKTGARLE